MSSVELQAAPEDATITQALGRVRAAGGGGVVAIGEGEDRVLSVDDLLHALRTLGDVPLSAVETTVARVPRGAAGPVTVTMAPAGAPLVRSPRAQPTPMAIVEGLGASDVTTLRASLALFTCTLDPTHVWLADELAQPGRCNLDGAPVTAS